MKIVNEAIKTVLQFGGIFVRKSKHGYLYKLPNGKFVQISSTPKNGCFGKKYLEKEFSKMKLRPISWSGGNSLWFTMIKVKSSC
jgi:hypothetical protein